MPAATLARFILIDALRSGLPWLALASLVLALAVAAFLSQVAVTESLALQVSVVAARRRLVQFDELDYALLERTLTNRERVTNMDFVDTTISGFTSTRTS